MGGDMDSDWSLWNNILFHLEAYYNLCNVPFYSAIMNVCFHPKILRQLTLSDNTLGLNIYTDM